METTIVYWGCIGDNGKDNGNYSSIWGLFGVILGIMERTMETTLVYGGHIGYNGKEHGNYYSLLGLYWV